MSEAHLKECERQYQESVIALGVELDKRLLAEKKVAELQEQVVAFREGLAMLLNLSNE